MPKPENKRLLVDQHSADDASVYLVRDDLAIINTVDFFTPIVDDPYLYGSIAAANALSDVYAMGGTPITALNILGFPQGKLTTEIVAEIMRGGAEKAAEAGCVIAGGHSIQDKEIKYGLAVTGTVHPDKIWRNNSIEDGDVLILTKPLGTGAVSTALKQGKATPQVVDNIVASMTTLNRVPAEMLQKNNYTVNACTDITGYGLAGHLLEMVGNERLSIQVELDKLPLFKEAKPYLKNPSFLPGGFYNNRLYCQEHISTKDFIEDEKYNILFDPQTSGGLVLALPEEQAENFLQKLKDDFTYPGWLIGRVIPREQSGGKIQII